MRALIVLTELWVASEIVLTMGPLRDAASGFAVFGLFLGLCCALTFLVTYPRHRERDAPMTRQLLPVQLAVVLAIVALTGWTIAARTGVTHAPPLWGSIDRHLALMLRAVAAPGLADALRTFAECALLPLVLLLALRVPWHALGLGAFTRGSAKAAAIWLLLPVFALAYLAFYADASLALIGRGLLANFVGGGFSEELLFRGALFGRLRSLLPAQWAAFAQALVFGLWRFGEHLARGHSVATALALVVPAQAAFGYAMALVARRTGNVAVPALLHTALDTIRGIA